MATPTYKAFEEFSKEAGYNEDLERDPYSVAVAIIANVLEDVLDDGINEAMNETEFITLETLARILSAHDDSIEIEPRPG